MHLQKISVDFPYYLVVRGTQFEKSCKNTGWFRRKGQYFGMW